MKEEVFKLVELVSGDAWSPRAKELEGRFFKIKSHIRGVPVYELLPEDGIDDSDLFETFIFLSSSIMKKV